MLNLGIRTLLLGATRTASDCLLNTLDGVSSLTIITAIIFFKFLPTNLSELIEEVFKDRFVMILYLIYFSL